MTIVLASQRLRVEIADPASVPGHRFDRSAFITGVVLDGEHGFCAAEDPGGTGGVGLCSEFGIDRPIGFDDVDVGGWFPKPGVGLLRRADRGAYRFWDAYEVRPFAVRVAVAATVASFTTSPEACAGFAFETVRRVAVSGQELLMTTSLLNRGERALTTDEYCHNFLAPGGLAVGRAHRLTWSHGLAADPCDAVVIAARGASWRERPRGAFYAPMRVAAPARSSWWRLTEGTTGLTVSERDSFRWSRFALFGTTSALSPEAFIQLEVAPGERVTWSRRYRFERRAARRR